MDNETFNQIIRTCQAPLRDLLAGMGVGPSNVDDLAQEAFLIFYRQPEKCPAEITPLLWLKGIARNLARAHFRKQATAPRHLDWLLDVDAPISDLGQTPETSRLEALRLCLGTLNTDHRTILTRYYGEDLKAEDLGSDSGQSANAVRKLMLRLREHLRVCVLKRLALEQK